MEFIGEGDYLNLYNINTSTLEENWETIFAYLKTNNKITCLDLSLYKFKHGNIVSIESICEIIKHNTTIQRLKLSQNYIDENEFNLIVDALAFNNTITMLELHNNPIGDNGLNKLTDVLRTNYSISYINLQCCSIDGESIINLANVLTERNIVTELFYSGNRIDDLGVSELAKAPISTLTLRSELITDEGLISLASNEFIERHDLVSDSITDDGIIQMANLLKHNTSLKTLYLVSENIEDIGKQALAEALDFNTTIESIIMYGDLHSEIARKLEKNKILRPAIKNLFTNIKICYEDKSENYLFDDIIQPYILLNVLETLPK